MSVFMPGSMRTGKLWKDAMGKGRGKQSELGKRAQTCSPRFLFVSLETTVSSRHREGTSHIRSEDLLRGRSERPASPAPP